MSWKAEYIILIIITTLITYYSAIQIAKHKNKIKKKIWLYIGLLSSLSILFTFKYFNFFNQAILEIIQLFSLKFSPLVLNIVLPVGISFYTFQSIGYLLDVYWGQIKPEKHLGIFSLYITFFPQLVAGPIERAGHLLPQFRKKHHFNYESFITGLKYMIWGFFLKVVIADRIATFVNVVYNEVTNYTGLPLIMATYFFAFQIFCDFAGYSLIAIGSAKIMGFDLMENFKRPYFAKSVSEFWRRWHISLSSWFRDYIYIPLGGNRVRVHRLYFNLSIIFLVSGIWHGANWTFIIWGILHGIYVIFSLVTLNVRTKIVKILKLNNFPKLYYTLQVLITFHLVLFAWIFFRANSLSDAIYIVTHLFTNFTSSISQVTQVVNLTNLILFVILIGIMEIIHLMEENDINCISFFERQHIIIRWGFYYMIIFSILLLGKSTEIPFIYFQF